VTHTQCCVCAHACVPVGRQSMKCTLSTCVVYVYVCACGWIDGWIDGWIGVSPSDMR
jgi:hypothetical protein